MQGTELFSDAGWFSLLHCYVLSPKPISQMRKCEWGLEWYLFMSRHSIFLESPCCPAPCWAQKSSSIIICWENEQLEPQKLKTKYTCTCSHVLRLQEFGFAWGIWVSCLSLIFLSSLLPGFLRYFRSRHFQNDVISQFFFHIRNQHL